MSKNADGSFTTRLQKGKVDVTVTGKIEAGKAKVSKVRKDRIQKRLDVIRQGLKEILLETQIGAKHVVHIVDKLKEAYRLIDLEQHHIRQLEEHRVDVARQRQRQEPVRKAADHQQDDQQHAGVPEREPCVDGGRRLPANQQSSAFST